MEEADQPPSPVPPACQCCTKAIVRRSRLVATTFVTEACYNDVCYNPTLLPRLLQPHCKHTCHISLPQGGASACLRRIYIYTYVCVCVCMCVCVCVCVCVYTYTHTHTHIHIHIFIYTHTHIYVFASFSSYSFDICGELFG